MKRISRFARQCPYVHDDDGLRGADNGYARPLCDLFTLMHIEDDEWSDV